MSKEIGLRVIHCKPTPRCGHTEYSMEYHTSLINKIANKANKTGFSADNLDYTPLSHEILRRFYEAWEYDFLWCTHDGPIDWTKAGRCTDMGHAAYAADGKDKRPPQQCPFKDVNEVWNFDPAKEYGMPDFEELVKFYEKIFQTNQFRYPDQIVTGGYYKTVISGAIQSFGWEMLLMSASDELKFAKVLERFGEYTLHHTRAWSKTSIEVFIQHDDIVWTFGPFMRPDFYRQVLFPIYRELWKPLKACGKKILFCSDGKIDMFLEDIADCGADGFIFEPCNDFEKIVNSFGGHYVLIGSKVDCRTMAFGTWEQVKNEIDTTLELTRNLPGFVFAVGNHIPPNVSDDMCERFINYLRQMWHSK